MRKQLIILMMMAFPAIIMAQTAIDCIDPKYEHVDDSCEFVLVDYRDSIKVWENCCLESYTQSPPPGEVSAPGDKLEVTLTAIDCQGNVASISFPVFVLDTIPPKFYCDDDGDVGKPPVEEIRRRVIVLTDPNVDPNKESDDKMSLVRLMLYSNEFDIEGIVATCSHNLYARYTEPIYDAIDAFEQALPNLKNHAGNWPTADYLRSVTALGPASYGTMFALNEEPISDGGRLIVNALMVDDPRPLWVTIWGDGAVIVQALEYIKATQGEQAALDASLKLRVLDNAGQDDSGAWLKAAYHYPYTFYVRWVRGGMAMDSISDTPTGISWFPYCGECAKGDVSYVSDYWVEKNIQPKGPLGAEYPDRRYLKEGDSPTMLYLIPNGLNDPEHPHMGSWGGSFTREPQPGVRSIRHPLGRADEFTESEFDPYYMDEFVEITWNGYTSHYASIFRYWEFFQNDFLARINWTMTPNYLQANHPPRPFIGLDGSRDIVYMDVQPGSQVQLSAAASTDPDDFEIHFNWEYYGYAGTYPGDVIINGESANSSTINIPPDASGYEIHIVLAVTDIGSPPLRRYRRVILTVA